MTFAIKLRQLRDDKGLSERKLADLSGVSFAAIHEYGGGRRKPSFSAVVKIARALGVTCEAFAACEDIAEDTPGSLPGQPVTEKPKRMGDGSRPKKKPGGKGGK